MRYLILVLTLVFSAPIFAKPGTCHLGKNAFSLDDLKVNDQGHYVGRVLTDHPLYKKIPLEIVISLVDDSSSSHVGYDIEIKDINGSYLSGIPVNLVSDQDGSLGPISRSIKLYDLATLTTVSNDPTELSPWNFQFLHYGSFIVIEDNLIQMLSVSSGLENKVCVLKLLK